MKAHLDIQHEGTLDDSRVRMQIDSNSTAFLMSILTDLYSDPEMAVIREYSTNALDSHKAAGVSAPIEVELPSSLRPLFIVRDHGLGMSVDEIVNNFSKYGWSSKRETNEEVGMLGLGCKSGLTYTSQFTLIAIKDGIKTTVLVTREADGAGAIQIIDTVPTYEPNGVEVQIPVRSSANFITKSHHFFSFWTKGSVLVNGNPPEHVSDTPDTLILDPDVILSKGLAHDYVVMGNVAYPLERRILQGTAFHVVAWVPIGAVDFVPSREALQQNNRTTEAVEDIREFVLTSLHRMGQEDVDGAPNHWEALKRSQRWREASRYTHRSPRFVYRGEKVPLLPFPLSKECSLRWRGPDVSNASERPRQIDIATIERSIFLVGHNGRSLNRQDKERLGKWFANEGLPFHTPVIALPRLPEPSWLEAGARVLHLDDLREYKIQTPVRKVGLSVKGRYRVLNSYGDVNEVAQLASNVVWVPADLRNTRADLMGLFGMMPDTSVVPVPKAQVDRFLRENPGAVSFKTFIEAIVYLFATQMSPRDLARITMSNEINNSKIGALHEVRDHIIDPELHELVGLFGPIITSHDVLDVYRALANACSNPYVGVPLPVFGKDAKLVRRIRLAKERYPLLEHLNIYSRDKMSRLDFVRYINLIHFSES